MANIPTAIESKVSISVGIHQQIGFRSGISQQKLIWLLGLSQDAIESFDYSGRITIERLELTTPPIFQ